MEQGQPHDKLLLEDETALAAEQPGPGEADAGPVLLVEDLAFPVSSPPAPSRFAGVARRAARMLLAVLFSQYVIVTMLVAAAAVALSRTASGLLAAKFDAIARTIRHF